MKTLLALSLLSFLLLPGVTKLESSKFDIEILQNGVPVEITDNTVTLDKKEFAIRVTLKNQEGISMICSTDREYYDLKDDEKIRDYDDLGAKTAAENNFNSDGELMLDNDYVSYLFYDKTMDWHRFDKDVKVEGENVIGIKTVDKVWLPKKDKTIDLKNFKKDIYLFFVSAEPSSESVRQGKELGRLKLHIKWK